MPCPPITAPKPEHINLLDKAPDKVNANAYDLVPTEMKLAEKSIRFTMHKPKKKCSIYLDLVAEAKPNLVFNEASIWCPSHGGIALGLDSFRLGEQELSCCCYKKTTVDAVTMIDTQY